MSTPGKPSYNFSDLIFRQMPKYIRWAKEHLSLSELNTSVISWEVKDTFSELQIPTKYHIHYRIKSIIGIDDEQEPVFGNYHIMELTLPPNYPMEPCKLQMITPIWHPNIKSGGKHIGRICGNVKNFGKSFDLYQLVLRIGEILQYKNYHATHTPPYPEDSKVAHWVLEYAEPHGLVNKDTGVAIDDTPLVGNVTEAVSPSTANDHHPTAEADKNDGQTITGDDKTETLPDDINDEASLLQNNKIQIKVGEVRKNKNPKLQLKIKKKNNDLLKK